MNISPQFEELPDVPSYIFKEFLKALRTAEESAELIKRLNKTLLQDKAYTERALKDAIFGEETIP